MCATRGSATSRLIRVVTLVLTLCLAQGAAAQQTSGDASTSKLARAGAFVAGAALGLAAHEGGHLLFDVAFDADPVVRKVDFHGIPFFAITHRNVLSPRREQVVSAAGFWVQHAGSEWLLTTRPRLRHERAPLLKGVLAFNVLASAAYSGAAFGRTGPIERDTRGMADAARVDERWIGAIVLAPAVFDTWRYFDPDARWPAWAARATKAGMLLLLLRAGDS